VAKHSYDDIIITVGALVLGLGLLKFFEGPRYAYAGAACASACAPFKNSPGTYATCCKQHAATAAAAKPKVPARPAGFRTATLTPFQKANPLPVTKSKAPKPASTHQLQNDQVKKVADTNKPENVDTQKDPVSQLFGQVRGNDSSSAPSGGGGAVAQGALPYTPKRTLGTFQIDRSKGINGRNYHSGGSSDTTEANVTDIGNVTDQMAVVYFNFPANCRGTHGDEADIKLWGPAHHNGNCCWCLVSINGNGDVCTGGEGNHPHTDKCRQKVNNVGNIKGKDIGLAHVIRQTSAGAHSEVWVDLGNGFKLMGHADGKCYGPDNGSSTPSANQQPQFRCDCMPNGQYVQIHSAVVYEI